MSDSEIRKAVASQIVNMIENDVLRDCGGESLIGWCEDGEVFFNNGMSEEDIEKAMQYVREINDAVTDIVYKLADF